MSAIGGKRPYVKVTAPMAYERLSQQRVVLVDEDGVEIDISRWCVGAVITVTPGTFPTVDLTMFTKIEAGE